MKRGKLEPHSNNWGIFYTIYTKNNWDKAHITSMIYEQFAVVRRPNIVQSTTQHLIVSVCNFEVTRNIID